MNPHHLIAARAHGRVEVLVEVALSLLAVGAWVAVAATLSAAAGPRGSAEPVARATLALERPASAAAPRQ